MFCFSLRLHDFLYDVFCLQGKTDKTKWKINKLLRNIPVTSLPKKTKNKVTKMGWNAHLSPEPYQFFPSKFSRYHVGGIHESLEFQILTGVLVRGENIFWNIFISIAVVISGISMASLTLKQLVESFRDHRILHKVCINIVG